MSKKHKEEIEKEPEAQPVEEEPVCVDHFVRVWELLAAAGKCDASHGVQYRRLLRKWHKEGRPGPVVHWIKDHANRGPDDEE